MTGPSANHGIWWAAARSGLRASFLGIMAAVVVAVLAWLPAAGTSGQPTSAVRAGLLAFLDAHRGGLTVDGVPTAFVPLGLLAVIVLIAWRAGLALSQVLTEYGESSPRRIGGLLAVQVAAYVSVCAGLVPLSRLGTTHAPLVATLVAALLVFGLSSALAVAVATGLGSELLERLPTPVRHGARAAAAVTAVYLAAGAVLAAGSLVLHAGRVMDLSRQVGGGSSGIPIAILGVLSAPNAAVAGTAYLAGPGFAVGSGTAVNAFSTSHGLLPAFPILGAVPSGHGANAATLALMVLTPVLGGLVCALLIRRAGSTQPVSACLAVASAAVMAGLAMGLLGWLGGGAVGTARLRVVGASPWRLGLAVAAECAAVGLLIFGGQWLWLRFGPAPATNAEDIPEGGQLITSPS